MKPLVLVNFKTYDVDNLKLAKVIDKFKSKYQFMVVPRTIDLLSVRNAVKIPVFAQHVDVGFGTGNVLASRVKKIGCAGTLINHSERRLSLKEIALRVKVCKRVGLKSVVCASSLGMVKKVFRFKPDYVAYEPRRLVGGNVSVTAVNPKVISKAVKLVGKRLLVGAGVHSRSDVLKALELGASGVLIAHKIVKARNVKSVLKRMFN